MLEHLVTWVSKLFNKGSERLESPRPTSQKWYFAQKTTEGQLWPLAKGLGHRRGNWAGESVPRNKRKPRKSGRWVASRPGPSSRPRDHPRHPRGTCHLPCSRDTRAACVPLPAQAGATQGPRRRLRQRWDGGGGGRAGGGGGCASERPTRAFPQLNSQAGLAE